MENQGYGKQGGYGQDYQQGPPAGPQGVPPPNQGGYGDVGYGGGQGGGYGGGHPGEK